MNTAQASRPPRAPGYWYALSGFLLGSVESVAFNVLAAFITPTGYAFEAWLSLVPALLGAAVWPVALLVSVEVLARVEWSRHWGWWVLRVSGIVAVALGSAVISYGHIHAVLEFWGYGWKEAAVGPLVIDGLMLISGFALYTIGRAARAVVNASPGAIAEPPAASSRTTDAPARPDPSVRQEHAVPGTSSQPPDDVPGTAPQEASPEPPGLRLVPSQRLLPDPKTTSRKTSQKPSCSDEDVFAEIASYASREGRLPTANWLKTNLSKLGHKRASELLSEYVSKKQEVTA